MVRRLLMLEVGWLLTAKMSPVLTFITTTTPEHQWFQELSEWLDQLCAEGSIYGEDKVVAVSGLAADLARALTGCCFYDL